MLSYECISCGATFSTRKKLSAHKPQCKDRPSLTDDVFQQRPIEKRARHASPIPMQSVEIEQDLEASDDLGPEVYPASYVDYQLMKLLRAQTAIVQSWPQSPPPVLSKRSGRHIRMPARYADFLPGSATHLEHMPPSSRQQCGQAAKSPSPIPLSPTSSQRSSIANEEISLFTTEPDDMGLYRTYIRKPTHTPTDTLNSLVDAPTLESNVPVDTHLLHGPPEANEQPDYFTPFTNPSNGLLMAYQYSGSTAKSGAEIDRLPIFLNHPMFHAPDTLQFSHTREQQRLDAFLENTDSPFPVEHGWKCSSIKIPLPKERSRFMSENEAPQLEIGGIYHRDLSNIIRAAFEDDVFTTFNTTPFTQYWKVGERVQEVFSEAYASAEMRQAYDEINSLPQIPGDNLERVVASLMIWSDSTHLTSFGDASLWPFYLFFGNESKYTRGKPTSNACHHVAYIPTVSFLYLV